MIENAKKFLEELDVNEKARELLKAALDESSEDVPALVKIAHEIGFDVSEDELQELLAGMQGQQAAASDAVADQVRDLSIEDLDVVAGGGDHPECSDTYKDDENCFSNDHCAKVYHYYLFCEMLAFQPDCDSSRFGFPS